MIRRVLCKSFIAASLLPFLAACGRAQSPAAQTKLPGTFKQIRFPEAWEEIREGVSWPQPAYLENLEARRAPGATEGEYLIAGMIGGDGDYLHELYTDIPPPLYTRQFYSVNFEDNFRVRPATRQEWEAAKRVSSPPRMLFVNEHARNERREIVYRGLTFARSGEHPSTARLSPGGRRLAVFSYSGKKTKPSLFFGGGEPRTGDAFWDIYDTLTGERIAAWSARGVESPASYNKATTWIGERYFLAPAEERAQAYLIFTLPQIAPIENPRTLDFAQWRGEDGTEMRLPSPQQDKDIESSAREYAMRRPLNSSGLEARELLFRLKDEYVVILPPSRGPDGGGMRGRQRRTNYSTDIYAVALDGTYRVRAATPAEWDAAKEIKATQTRRTLDETHSTLGGERRDYRHFARTGANWGTPKALVSSDWITVFSYTPHDSAQAARPHAPSAQTTQQTASRAGGTLHVEIYDTRPGELMLAGRMPYAGSANAVFERARWYDQNYLVIPLEESYRSCQLWMLPEVHKYY